MPLSPEQLGLTRQVDVDSQGGAVRVITKKGVLSGPVTEHKDSEVRFEEGILALRYFAHRIGEANLTS